MPDELPPAAPLTGFDLRGLVGLSEVEARLRTEAAGGVLRAVAPGSTVTLEYRPNRITVIVEDGRVTTVRGVG